VKVKYFNKKTKLKVFDSYDSLSIYAVNLIKEFLKPKIPKKNKIIVLPGGKSPSKLFANLKLKNFNWSGITILLSDERLVKPDDINSNYALVTEIFSNKENIPQIFPDMRGFKKGNENIFLDEMNTKFEKMPKISLSFLGVGEDGHTASIFPNKTIISSKKTPYFLTKKEDESFYRISLSEK